jgi:UDP-N-acetylmuramoyl-L-alanyl-D-glutamate--2,6-diaminopimelate ligase
VDRKEAIRTACMLAEKGDVILVAGKGHEDYQDVKGVKHHFDDREILRAIFNPA